MYWELSGDKCPSNPERPEMEKGPGKDARPGPSLVQVRSPFCSVTFDTYSNGVLSRWLQMRWVGYLKGLERRTVDGIG